MKDKLQISVDDLPAAPRFAVGNDLVFVPDFKLSLTDVFKQKVYTAEEIAYCDSFADSLLRYASTWAAKEAIYKAFKQLSNATLAWKNICITREKAAGKPLVILASEQQQPHISLSISHDGDYVWAIAFIEIKKD
jgi:holo-[acyl-carrier protein] synthase